MKLIVKIFKNSYDIKFSKQVKLINNNLNGKILLNIKCSDEIDKTEYMLKTENKFGLITDIVYLPIAHEDDIIPPEIVLPLRAQVVPTGSDVVLHVEYKSNPIPKVKWQKNGKIVVENEDTIITNKLNETTLILRNISKPNVGKYEVVLSNPQGTTKTSATVAISDKEPDENVKPPTFVENLKPRSAHEKEVVIFETNVISYPVSSFQWYFNDKPITHESIKIVNEENHSILLIKEFINELVGSYTCCAENVVGMTTTSASLSLITTDDREQPDNTAPKFIKTIGKLTVMDGEKLVIKHTVTGKPVPSIKWYRNSEEINDTKDITMSQNNAGECILSITEVFPEDEGEYECKATNKLGEVSTISSVIVEGILIYDYDHSKTINILRFIFFLFLNREIEYLMKICDNITRDE